MSTQQKTIDQIKDEVNEESGFFNYRTLSNGVKVGNIKQRELETVWTNICQRAQREALEAQSKYHQKLSFNGTTTMDIKKTDIEQFIVK